MKDSFLNFLKRNHLLLNVIGVYLLTLIIIFPLFRFVLNPDGISYINIAKKYLSGNVNFAVNGYWSPLFSWLLLPFLALNIEALLATKILSIIIGIFLLIAVNKLLISQKITDIWRAWALFTLIPLLVMFTLIVVTPDLLLCVMLINYLNSLLDKTFTKYRDQALTVGWFGALAYLTKAYALLFFLVHFTVSIWIIYRRYKLATRKRFILSQWLIGMFIFIVISGSWSFIISKKYHRLTFSTAGEFNRQLSAKGVITYPKHIVGLIEPLDKLSTSYWDDPSNIQLVNPSKHISIADVLYRLKLIYHNFLKILGFINSLSIFALTIIIFSIFIYSRRIYIRKHIMLFMVLIYPLFYLLIITEERHLWSMFVLILVLAAGLLNYWQHHNKLSKLLILFTGFIVFISFQYLPWMVRHMKKPGNELVILSQQLNKLDINKKRIASLGNNPDSLYLAYYSNNIYLGELGLNFTKNEIIKEINNLKINYLWIWEDAINIFNFSDKYQVVFNIKTPRLIIYKVQ